MAEFKPVDIKKYLHDSRKALDRIDTIPVGANSVNSVKPFSRESVEKKYQEDAPSDVQEADDHANTTRGSYLHLPPTLLHNLMLWVAKFHELRLEVSPDTVILDAKPQQVVEASEAHPWGVVYDPERYLLMSWGDVPRYALTDKRDLETGELLIAEQVAA